MAIPLIAGVIAVVTVGGLAGVLMQMFPPLANAKDKLAFKTYPNLNPSIIDLINQYYLEQISYEDFIERCAENGFDETNANNAYEASKTLLTATDYVTLWRRGELDEKELADKLKHIKFDAVTIPELKKVTEFFPSAPDLIRFAVRDVYSPEIVSQFGLMEDIPQKFLDEAFKSGLPVEQAKNFWASHWELPSMMQAFSMFQRRFIPEDTLKLLMKAKDISPAWRDPLLKLSYNPLTRVDVRRMYGMGVLKEDDVYNAYLDAGYNPENARRMTDFTVLYESDETTGLTRSSVVSAYKKGIITKEQLTEFFEGFGYTEEVQKFWVEMAEYEKALIEMDATTKELLALHRMGDITTVEVKQKLEELELPEVYINTVMAKLHSSRSERVKIPSQSQLVDWLKLELITDIQFKERMVKLGFEDADILLFLEQIELKQDTGKRKFLTTKIYLRWLGSKIITEEVFRQIGKDMKLSDADVDNLILEAKQSGK